jgi:hypothetical protein
MTIARQSCLGIARLLTLPDTDTASIDSLLPLVNLARAAEVSRIKISQ